METYRLMVSPRPGRHRLGLLTLEEVAARCHLHPELVRHFAALGMIDAAGEGERFSPEVAHQLQRILRLRHDLGINYNAAALILDLLERIDALETRLRQVESR